MKTRYYKNMGEIYFKSRFEAFADLFVICCNIFVNISVLLVFVPFLLGDDTLGTKILGVEFLVLFLIAWNFLSIGMLSLDNKNDL